MRTRVPLAELVVSAELGFASGARSEDGVLQVRMNCVSTEGLLDLTGALRVPPPRSVNRLFLASGDVLFNATNSPRLVGKTALFTGWPEPVTFSNHFLRLRGDPRRVDPAYLSRWLHSQWRGRVFEGMCMQWVNQASVRKERLLGLKIPLPPLPEQRRIAAILDKADAIRRKRQESLALLDQLLRSIFLEMFGDPVKNERGWEMVRLGEVAAIVSGVTKGRRTKAPTTTVPYLRVANVQDGFLDISEVKEILATRDEIERYRLMRGDLVLTEGGDPDKLGRGAVWQGETQTWIHQNHVFRVRVGSSSLLPDYLCAHMGSSYGKRYFLRAAKQTTGIASINKSQLSAFPAIVPPLALQHRYTSVIRSLDTKRERYTEALRISNDLFHSLSQRAFQGGL